MSVQGVFNVAMASKVMDIGKMGGSLIQRTQEEVAEKAPPPPPPASQIISDDHIDIKV
jgi:hypothetical protein